MYLPHKSTIRNIIVYSSNNFNNLIIRHNQFFYNRCKKLIATIGMVNVLPVEIKYFVVTQQRLDALKSPIRNPISSSTKNRNFANHRLIASLATSYVNSMVIIAPQDDHGDISYISKKNVEKNCQHPHTTFCHSG